MPPRISKVGLALLGVVVLTTTFGFVGPARAQVFFLRPTMEISPASGGEGTVIVVRSVDPCPLSSGQTAARARASLEQLESPVLDEIEGEVGDDGHWELRLVVPGSPPIHTDGLAVSASCVLESAVPASVHYQPEGFTYTGQLSAGADGSGARPSDPNAGSEVPDGSSNDLLPATGGGPPRPVLTTGILIMAIAALAVRWLRASRS